MHKEETMKLWRKTSFVILALFLCGFYVPPVSAQPPSDGPSLQTKQSITADAEMNLRDPKQEVNKKALEKLGKMSPDKVDALDSKLAEALTLYYDGKYGQALPIFNTIASEVETMDIMWWIGTSAMKSGELNLAVKKFQAMLAINPGLHRVRLDLAAAYFQLGRYEESRKELETVKAANPPEMVQKNIDGLLAAISEATRKYSWNVRFAQGLQYDSNVSAGPDKRQFDVLGGILTLADDGKKISDTAAITNFNGSFLYHIDRNKGLMWNTGIDFYQAMYFNHNKYDYRLIDFTTGPWWAGRNNILKLPVGIAHQDFGSKWLSNILHVDPSYEHHFSPYFGLKGSLRYARELFYSDANDPLKNESWRYEVMPSIYLANRRHIISLITGFERSEAEQRRFSYDGPYIGVSYFTRFPTRTEVFLRYLWSQRDYKEKPLFYNDDRTDRRHMITAVVSQGFYKHYFASFAFNYIDNGSNTELYRFSKETYTLSVGFYF
jgi:tetratricopeptide (TPR) repeat protein